MGITDKLFKWFKSKDKYGEEMNIGYVLDGAPKSNQELKKVFKAFELESKFELFLPLIRPTIDIESSALNDEKIRIGQSKIGGKPDLDKNTSWPITNSGKSLSFIGQLNCSEIANHDTENLLPKNGLISFFYCADQEAWGYDPKDTDRFKVFFTENLEGLKREDFPNDLESHSIFQSNELTFESSLSVPGWEYECIDGFISDDESDNYDEVSRGAGNQMFGYPDCIQAPMELACQLVTNGLFCGDSTGYDDPRRKDLEKGEEDWILLFQIDSEEDYTEMMWGDSGKLYFWIRKQDLKDRKFEKSWFQLQCY